ncbi:acyltransferase family protein, partial [Thermodesulfobacteriota bacterium]
MSINSRKQIKGTMEAYSSADIRARTDYLRGVAIVVIMIGHYWAFYISEAIYNYPDGIVGLFFVLSGYGIYSSFQRNDPLSGNNFLSYLWRRALRIYPLYWVSLLMFAYTRHTWPALTTWLAVPWIQAPSIYWFVTSLMQCYLLAPIFYAIQKRVGLGYAAALLLALMLGVHGTYAGLLLPQSKNFFIYRFMFMGHLFLFLGGMLLPQAVTQLKTRLLTSKKLCLVCLLVFAVLVHFTRFQSLLFTNSVVFIMPLFIVIKLLLCLLILTAKPLLPVRKLLVFLGRHSYSLYLFHVPFFTVLARVGIINRGSLASVAYTLALFPLFAWGCVYADRLAAASLRFCTIDFLRRWGMLPKQP